jgi:UDP-glucose 4-epimerase
MAIMITGGTGSLGYYLAKGLIREGYHDIVLFDAYPNYNRIADLPETVRVVTGDINDWTDIAGTIEKYRIREIFHLAAILSTEAREKPIRALKINVEGTVNILEASRMFNIQKVIFISTISTYGPGVPEPVNEDQRQLPTNLYGITKLSCELWGLYYHQQHGIDFRALRFPRIVNPGRTGTGVALFPSSMIENAALGKFYEVEVGEEFRVPIVYVKDAVGVLLALYAAQGIQTRVYNINGLVPTAKEILQVVQKFIGDAPIQFSQSPITPHLEIPLHYDDTKVQRELAWSMRYPLEEMVKDFIDEVRPMPES